MSGQHSSPHHLRLTIFQHANKKIRLLPAAIPSSEIVHRKVDPHHHHRRHHHHLVALGRMAEQLPTDMPSNKILQKEGERDQHHPPALG